MYPLVLIDARLKDDADALVAALGRALDPGVCACVVAPDTADPGLLAVIEVHDVWAVTAEPVPAWAAPLPPERQIAHKGQSVDAIVGELTGTLGATTPRRPRSAKLPPLDAAALGEGLAALDTRWQVELSEAPAALGGLAVALACTVICPTYVAAADLARALAELAETQDHHPTLVHDYNSLTVRVSTGEAAMRLTERDVRFARAVDAIVAARLSAR